MHPDLYFCLPCLLAARLMESMDPDIDPCEDFFEYSCGSWNRLNDIPDDRSFYNTFAKLRDIILVQLKGRREPYESVNVILDTSNCQLTKAQ